MNIGFPIVLLVVIAVLVYLQRHPDPRARARFLRRSGFTLMAIFSLFIALFVAGETFSDPGGWVALGLVALWAVPLGALVALSWYRPGWAVPVFALLVAAAIGISIWFAIQPGPWRAFEDRNGPVRTIAVFALSAAVAWLGLKRTAIAGWMLLVVGIVPIVVSTRGSDLGAASLLVASSPAVVAGILYLVSATLASRPAGPDRLARGRGPRAA